MFNHSAQLLNYAKNGFKWHLMLQKPIHQIAKHSEIVLSSFIFLTDLFFFPLAYEGSWSLKLWIFK